LIQSNQLDETSSTLTTTIQYYNDGESVTGDAGDISRH